MEEAVFCGGCFWCTEAVFKRLKGVKSVQSGYTGGFIKNPAYREVCEGRTGHAEGIRLEFNPQVISYKELLEIFFSTHNPTTLNRQGHDIGTQYRSAIFYTSDDQKDVALSVIDFLNQSNVFENSIVTTVEPLQEFYDAEIDHHDYYDQNKDQPYCQFVILPKIKHLNQRFESKLKSSDPE